MYHVKNITEVVFEIQDSEENRLTVTEG
jgi:hypothetical protein